ncbi:MGMT family protein [Phenylobacterium sp. LjRoot219]|uniref:methylated-DNA--[protein]-cysteine S-methyltransferase n=1 Tax=Phenylobacterium sp. LjRoot219 TaxID=3342283 RepID=UPI003ED00324
MTQFTLFETPLGWAAVAWTPAGLSSVRLPQARRESALAAVMRRTPDAEAAEPPPPIAAVIDDIRSVLAGGAPDFATAPLDLSRTPEFNARVYAVARKIRPGETLTYGEVAERLGDKRLARDVGQALGQNPWPIVVPCHRVTAAGGKLGGFSAPGGATTKLKLLALEGAPAAAQSDLFG